MVGFMNAAIAHAGVVVARVDHNHDVWNIIEYTLRQLGDSCGWNQQIHADNRARHSWRFKVIELWKLPHAFGAGVICKKDILPNRVARHLQCDELRHCSLGTKLRIGSSGRRRLGLQLPVGPTPGRHRAADGLPIFSWRIARCSLRMVATRIN